MVLDKLANDQITLRLGISQLDDAVKSVNKAARRLSLSVLIGSLIIGGGFAFDALRKADRLRGKRR
jgi:hypothetical protein